MDKDIISKILVTRNVSDIELNSFILWYVSKTKNKEPESRELSAINTMIRRGMFDITYAAKRAAIILGLQVTELHDINRNLIKTYVN